LSNLRGDSACFWINNAINKLVNACPSMPFINSCPTVVKNSVQKVANVAKYIFSRLLATCNNSRICSSLSYSRKNLIGFGCKIYTIMKQTFGGIGQKSDTTSDGVVQNSDRTSRGTGLAKNEKKHESLSVFSFGRRVSAKSKRYIRAFTR